MTTDRVPVDAVVPDRLADDDLRKTVDNRSTVDQILAQQAAVAAIGQRALGERNMDRLLAEIVEAVAAVLVTEFVSVLELAPDGRSLRLVAGRGWRAGIVGELVLGAQRGSMAGYTLATGQPVIVDDLAHEARFEVSSVLREHRTRSGMSVRIGEPENPYGALAVFTTARGHFTQDDANFLQAVGNVLAAAIARLRVEGELRRSRDEMAAIVGSVTDGITVQTRDGRLVFANDAAAHLTGYATAGDLLAAPLDEVIGRFELVDE
jgi:GAF domain-containing protein